MGQGMGLSNGALWGLWGRRWGCPIGLHGAAVGLDEHCGSRYGAGLWGSCGSRYGAGCGAVGQLWVSLWGRMWDYGAAVGPAIGQDVGLWGSCGSRYGAVARRGGAPAPLTSRTNEGREEAGLPASSAPPTLRPSRGCSGHSAPLWGGGPAGRQHLWGTLQPPPPQNPLQGTPQTPSHPPIGHPTAPPPTP